MKFTLPIQASLVVLSLCSLALAISAANAAQPIKVGVIGCDTSHVVAFTSFMNGDDFQKSFPGMKVVVAFAGGSDDIPASRDRVAGFTEDLQKQGVEMVDSIPELVGRCDAVLLESVDGRKHLPQFRQAAVGKPVFIDKPIAASLAETLEIQRVAKETNTPFFSCSALRFCDQVSDLQHDRSLGKILGCDTACPYSLEEHHPDFFWYGVHGVESLFTVMGAGCEEVSCVETDSAGLAVGKWKDGRLGTFRGLKEGGHNYAITVYGSKKIAGRVGFAGYEPLVDKIAKFFVTKQPPVDMQETIEIVAFMEAAQESKHQGGKPVRLAAMIERAQHQLDAAQ